MEFHKAGGANPALLSASANAVSHLKLGESKKPSATGTPMGSGFISASSWRIGEAIVQKQLKQHLRQQKQTKDPNAEPKTPDEPKLQKRSESAALASSHSPYSTRVKRTDCHLVSESKPTSHLKHSQSTSQTKTAKGKAYEASDVQEYIKNQKKKRIYESKSEKEKQNREKEERKKKLEELYRKQRSQAVRTTPPAPEFPTNMRSRRSNPSGSKSKLEVDKALGKLSPF